MVVQLSGLACVVGGLFGTVLFGAHVRSMNRQFARRRVSTSRRAAARRPFRGFEPDLLADDPDRQTTGMDP